MIIAYHWCSRQIGGGVQLMPQIPYHSQFDELQG